jgi:hypothetical protein
MGSDFVRVLRGYIQFFQAVVNYYKQFETHIYYRKVLSARAKKKVDVSMSANSRIRTYYFIF